MNISSILLVTILSVAACDPGAEIVSPVDGDYEASWGYAPDDLVGCDAFSVQDGLLNFYGKNCDEPQSVLELVEDNHALFRRDDGAIWWICADNWKPGETAGELLHDGVVLADFYGVMQGDRTSR